MWTMTRRCIPMSFFCTLLSPALVQRRRRMTHPELKVTISRRLSTETRWTHSLRTVIVRASAPIHRGRPFSLIVHPAGLLTSLSSEDNLGMDNLPSSMSSFPLAFDNQIETFLAQWKTDLDDLVLQPTLNQQATAIVDAPIPSKIRLAGLFDIPLPELRFQSSAMKEANRFAEQQLNRTYAIELNPNEKLGDFRLRVPDMAIEVPVDTHSRQPPPPPLLLLPSIHSSSTPSRSRPSFDWRTTRVCSSLHIRQQAKQSLQVRSGHRSH